jgi:ABC-type Mn2+/Zn2+ transport system ATPase subunit
MSPQAASGVEVAAVWKRYRRRAGWVLREVDLTLEPGRIALVLGGNGAGKSTLLRIVAGASRPTRGAVRRPFRSTAYAPERLPAESRLDARQYLTQLARLRGIDPDAAWPRAEELLERLGLFPGPYLPIGQLSKGNRQKVALAQAFVASAELTVLDEPFAALDEPAARAVSALIDRSRAEGRSVLLTGHAVAAFPGADLVRVLESGRLGPVAPDPPTGPATMRLELRPLGPAPLFDVHHHPEVEQATTDPRTGALTLLTSDADAVLRRLLAGGWSLSRAEPIEDAQEPDDAGPSTAAVRPEAVLAPDETG